MTNSSVSVTVLQAENAALRHRIAVLEQQATQRPASLSALLEDLPFPLAIYQPDGLMIAANAHVERLFGISRASMVGAYNLNDDPATIENGFRAGLTAALRGEHHRLAPSCYDSAEYALAPQQGQQIWIEASFFPIHDATGAVEQVAGTFHDVTARLAADAERARALAEQQRVAHALREKEARLRVLVTNVPVVLCAFDQKGTITFADGKGLEALGLTPAQLVGRSALEVYRDSPEVVDDIQQALAGRSLDVVRQIGPLAFETWYEPLLDDNGATSGVIALSTNITERQHADVERQALQEQVIQAQQAALRELSTPLIPISDGVIALPLVGTIDSSRAQQVMETLLEGIGVQQAAVALLDITGVRVVDTQVANALLRAAQAAKLLGAQVVLTGISAEVAQTLVQLGADLHGIVTCNNLQSGISYALEHAQN